MSRAARLRRNAILIVVMIGVVYVVLRDPIDRWLTPPCDQALVLDPSLPPETRNLVEALQDQELLYCPPTPSGLAGFSGPVYWASDGVNSLLYYGFSPDNRVGIGRYEFTGRPVMAAGDAAPAGLIPTGRPAYRNEAPKGAPFYLVTMGAPRHGEVGVAVDFHAHGEPQAGYSNRNFWTDGMNALRRLRGDPLTTESSRVQLTFAIVPDRWASSSSVWSDPVLDSAGTGDFRGAALVDPPPELALARVVSGNLGAGAWVAGVISGTRPALTTVPDGDLGRTTELASFSLWRTRSGLPFALFALPALDSGVPYSFEIWADAGDKAAGKAPDKVTQPIVLAKPTPGG